ncbi:MAG: hypothetical protein CSA49_01240 [Gammaproteobacteria bacterium]|nr:MAG: hypothetical protein CSA49_01240 [Gammaproteobacteria bacterium]
MKQILIAFVALWLAACAELPTEQVVSGENNAGLSFKLVATAQQQEYQVYIDGLLMGNVADFLAGEAILKILPGSHIVRVTRAGQIVLEEKLYVAAGANKVLVVR